MINFDKIKIGDKVFISLINNSVEEYVYAGIFSAFNEWDKQPRHVFINSHLNNLYTLIVGKEDRDFYKNRVFLTKDEAIKRLKEIREEEAKEREED